ncbi:MAG: (deoxy)nucleoside triphosphate pyrophosphohydrolase [Mobilitalea sp.]
MKIIEVVAAIIVKNSEILATKRGYGDFINMWEFPGGKMEPEESKEAALIREIKEELEVAISVDHNLCTIEYDYPNFHLTMHCFICSITSGDLTLVEHNDAKWLTTDTLHSVQWLPADIQILEQIREWFAKK